MENDDETVAIHQLQEQISRTLHDLHDFAKWKLLSVAALAAAALGLGNSNRYDSDWLLVFVPFACMYVDLNCYQYILRILLMAKTVREKGGHKLYQAYETECENFRQRGYFGLGLIAQVGCSLMFSLILPAIGLTKSVGANNWNVASLTVIWSIGLVSLVVCYADFVRRAKMLNTSDP